MYQIDAVSNTGHASYGLVRAATPDLAELARRNYLPVLNDGGRIEITEISGFSCTERGDIDCESGAEIVEVYVLDETVDGKVYGPKIVRRFRAQLETFLGIHVSHSGAYLGALNAEAAEAGREFLRQLATDGSSALPKGLPEEYDRWED